MANQKNTSKDVKYIDRDFDSLKKGLIEFTKAYYPNTYNDFNEASPGMMFIELAAYVGDVLNYYIDSQFKESMIVHATEKRNIYSIAASMGYKPKLTAPSVVDIDIYQLMPSVGVGTAVTPNLNYAVKIEPGMRARSTSGGQEFIIQNKIDFAINNIFDPTVISVYDIDANTGVPNYYLAKKTVKAISAQPKTTEIVVQEATKYFKFVIEDVDLIGIDSIVDADNNVWYEVPYLAQDTVFEQVQNTSFNDPDAATYSEETPYLLKLKRIPRRFVTRVTESGIEVQFGAGVSTSPDEELLATPENIGLTLPTGKDDIDFSIDPISPIITSTYGIAPSYTTLTVTYLVGGGIKANVPSNTISEIIAIDTTNSNLPTTNTILNTTILNSIAINNPAAASGGAGEESVTQVKQNALAQLASQNRAVTKEDYIVRAYAMPNKFGSVAKVYITPDEQNNITTTTTTDTVANPLAMNMYMLGYDLNKNLTTVNRAVKENLKTYLSQYRMLTDSINFRNAYIVNIGVSFDVIALGNYNANVVILNCIESIKSFFNIDKWQIGQPIYISDIFSELLKVEGVQSATNIQITNLNNALSGYSPISYNIVEATRNGIIYPSLDPAIFEVKYPNIDIKGRIATF